MKRRVVRPPPPELAPEHGVCVSSDPSRASQGAPSDGRNSDVPAADVPAAANERGIHAPLAELIGRTRYVVLVAVAGVLLIAMALFILGAGLAVSSVWQAALAALRGDIASTDLTVQFLEVVSLMMKAVIFYVIGVGLYSLFIAPLNVTTALGIETFNDLEIKIVSVIIVILAVTFLEHFILWEQPVEIILFGVSLAVVVAALVFFSNHSHRARQDLQREEGSRRARAQRELFEDEQEVRPSELMEDPAPAPEDERRHDDGHCEDHPASAEPLSAERAGRR